jgi:ribonuclease VapC
VIAVDTSAIVAIALKEPEARLFAEMIGSEEIVIGWPTVLEAHMVLAGLPLRRGLDVLDMIMRAPRAQLIPFAAEAFAAAAAAFGRYGKGRGHVANLNYGDCMAYAVAKVHRVPLLYKGGDFANTDVASALP